MCLQVRRLGLRQETEAAVRAAKQEQDGSDSEPTAGAGWCWLVLAGPTLPASALFWACSVVPTVTLQTG